MNPNLMVHQDLLLSVIHTADHKALQWTFVNAYKLNLFEMFTDEPLPLNKHEGDWIKQEFVGPEYSLSYKQCHYCGRLDADTRRSLFGKRLQFCHVDSCTSNPNPSEHGEGCVHGPWKLKKAAFLKQYERLESKSSREKAFWEFLEERHKANMQQTRLVTVEKARPLGWQSVLDPLRISTYEITSSINNRNTLSPRKSFVEE
jgi:hypothetical protein